MIEINTVNKGREVKLTQLWREGEANTEQTERAFYANLVVFNFVNNTLNTSYTT